jgi:hypothetical protein
MQPIEGLNDPDNFPKVPQSGTFGKLSGFYSSVRANPPQEGSQGEAPQ